MKKSDRALIVLGLKKKKTLIAIVYRE